MTMHILQLQVGITTGLCIMMHILLCSHPKPILASIGHSACSGIFQCMLAIASDRTWWALLLSLAASCRRHADWPRGGAAAAAKGEAVCCYAARGASGSNQ